MENNAEKLKNEDIDKLAEELVQRLDKVPKQIITLLQERAIEDAKKIFSKESINLEEVAYAIYRSLSLGLALGMDENLLKKD